MITPKTVPGHDITSVTVNIDGGRPWFLASNDAGEYIRTIHTTTLDDGAIDYRFTITDSAGRTQTFDYQLVADNTAPVITATLPEGWFGSGWLNGTESVSITVTESNLASAEVFIDGEKVRDLPTGTTNTTLNTLNYLDGEHDYTVVASDAAGNTATVTKTLKD